MSKIENTEVEEKDLVLQTEDGKEVKLRDIVQDAMSAGLKDAGFPIDEKGQFSMKNLSVEVQDAESKKMAGIEKAANFIKGIILPTRLHEQYGVKAIDTGSGSFGSVVPTELYDAIIEQSRRWTVIRKYAFVFKLAGKIDVPQEGTGVTAYWVAENAAVTESTPTTNKVTLDDHGVATLIKVSWKLLNTASQNIVDFIATLSAKAITDKEESAFVGGDGSGKPLGIRSTSGLTAIAQAGADFAYSDLLALYYTLPAGYRQNGVFLTSSKGARLIHGLVDDSNRPLFQPGQALDVLFNRPLIASEDIPANLGTGTNETEIYFGDMFAYWIKDGSEVEMATQDQIENLQTKVVVYKYVDGKIVNKSAFVKMTGVK